MTENFVGTNPCVCPIWIPVSSTRMTGGGDEDDGKTRAKMTSLFYHSGEHIGSPLRLRKCEYSIPV